MPCIIRQQRRIDVHDGRSYVALCSEAKIYQEEIACHITGTWNVRSEWIVDAENLAWKGLKGTILSPLGSQLWEVIKVYLCCSLGENVNSRFLLLCTFHLSGNEQAGHMCDTRAS